MRSQQLVVAMNEPCIKTLHHKAKVALEQYLNSKDIERAAIGMVAHYRKRRQVQYQQYLRLYVDLTKHPDFDESYKAELLRMVS